MPGSASTSAVITTSRRETAWPVAPAGGKAGAEREAPAVDPDGRDRHQITRRGIAPEQDCGTGPEQADDAVGRPLGHRGRIEGPGELAREIGQGRDPLGLSARRLGLPMGADVSVDASDEAQQPVLRVRADCGGEADQDGGGHHRADADAGEVLQQDLVHDHHHRGEDDVPVLQGERGEHHEEDVDPDRESGDPARVAGRERRPLEEEDERRVEERDRHAGGEHDARNAG